MRTNGVGPSQAMNRAWETLGAQYRTGANLNVRIGLHERFSTNPYPWPLWVFDQLALPPVARLLEVGCGTGELWRANRSRVPPGWTIVLSDRSAGMVRDARQAVEGDGRRFRFAVCDVQRLPFPDACFDAVIANHMLYHVPDLPAAIREIRRALRPSGRLYATANGTEHMRELDDLVPPSVPHLPLREAIAGFTLENGRAALERCFAHVETHLRDDALVVTEAAPLIAYCLSRPTTHALREQVSEEHQQAFVRTVEAALRTGGGSLHITKSTGMFVAS